MSAAVAYKFLPWLREGAATLINIPDDAANPAASFQTTAEVHFTGGIAGTTINLFGPADVVGLAKDQITRREPAPGSTGFEPNYFPSIEFRDADLPWRFTPTQAAGEDRLRPWLTLIALEQRDGVAVKQLPGAPLPVIAAPVKELPNPAELDRWAHVQVAGPFPSPAMDPASLEVYVRNNMSRAVARLLCPRRLEPNAQYLVCLVPVFEIGRLVGLGESPDLSALGLQYAWQFNETGTQAINLPVYDSWVVTTGPARDPREEFERLARSLHPFSIPAEAATRPFSVEAPLTTTPLTMQLAGALRPFNSQSAPPTPQDVATNLGAWVNQSAQLEEVGGEAEVAPPVYGRWQSGRSRVLTPGTPVWLNELNTDPRARAIAAIGGDIVQRNQDEFIAEAWRQAGEIREANQLLRGAQIARSANQSLVRKHLEKMPAGMLLQVAGPDRGRIRSGEGTLKETVSASAVPDSGVEAAFRRVARVRGPHTRNWNIGAPDETTQPLFQQGYVRVPADSWTVIDQGTLEAPSRWEHRPQTGRNTIVQTSGIYSLPMDRLYWDKPGTMYLTGEDSWRDFSAFVRITSFDDDAVGIVFRFTGVTSFYRFSMDSERSYRRLVKRTGNIWLQMWEDNFKYVPGHTYTIQVRMDGNHLRLFFNDQKIIDLHDSQPLVGGKFGLYTWGNSGTQFDDLTIDVQNGLDRSEIPSLVVDQGDFEGPSHWTTEDGHIRQMNIIRSTQVDRDELPKLGAYLKAVPDTQIPHWTDYATRVMVEAQDRNAIGLMFRYRNPGNFYRFSMDLERSYQRLVKCVDGQYTLLWQREEGFELNTPHWLEVVADGTRLRGYLDNRKLFDLRDPDHTFGTIAFYCWGSAGARFTYAQVRRIRRQAVMARLNAGQLGVPVPPDGQLNLDAVRSDLLNSLAPSHLVAPRTAERLRLPVMMLGNEDPLAPLGRAPELPFPLSTRLIEMAPNLMLPGVAEVPENAVVPLETNPAFVAALLAGANHEMTRELLWRGPASDIRATVFRQFWDVRGSAATTPAADIEPIHTWPANLGLASQTSSQSQPGSVFLIRSELLRRFPDARFYMIEAVSNGTGGRKPGTNISTPIFRGRFGDDIAFFGFAQSPAQVIGTGGGLGWYFVIEQRPDAGRFGLLLEGPDQPPDWTELGWNHVQGAAYVRATPLSIQSPPGPQWGRNAAHMAAITQRRPFRLLMHAKRLLSTES